MLANEWRAHNDVVEQAMTKPARTMTSGVRQGLRIRA